MKILITNCVLARRTGSELYVKEVAEALLRRGHTVGIFSEELGALADELRAAGILVTDDLSKIGWKPDIIHGQHYLETLAAIHRFPDVPVVFLRHGWRPWQERPPLHPNIFRYFAVDGLTLKNATEKRGVPEDRISLIHNFVDLDRFTVRGSLPYTPESAVVFNNVASESNFLPLVREACRRSGIRLDVMGAASGHPCQHPEKKLGGYDIVFAVGRSALEALATGTAVIVCGEIGVGPMVTTANFRQLRENNFGTATMYSGPDTDAINREIQKYDADDSVELTRELRSLIGISEAIDNLESIYHEAILGFRISGTGKLSTVPVGPARYPFFRKIFRIYMRSRFAVLLAFSSPVIFIDKLRKFLRQL